MEYEIKRIDIWSVVRVFFFLFLIIGFLISLIYVIIMSVASNFIQQMYGDAMQFPADAVGGFLSLFGMMFFSVVYALFMSLITAVVLGFYNIVSHYTGGIKMNLLLKQVQGRDASLQPPESERE